MSLPDRNNPYNFNEFLAWRRQVDYYGDDPFIQKVVRHFTGDAWENVNAEARTVSQKASFRWRDLTESGAWPEKRPYMMHYDGHHNRIDRIVRPRETEILEREIFSEAFFPTKPLPGSSSSRCTLSTRTARPASPARSPVRKDWSSCWRNSPTPRKQNRSCST